MYVIVQLAAFRSFRITSFVFLPCVVWYNQPMKFRGRPTKRKRPAFGARLAALRIERGITQLGLAKQMKVTRTLVRYYERESDDPKISVVQRCAEVLNVPVAILLGVNGVTTDYLDTYVARLAKTLMTMSPKKRDLAIRLFSRQLEELNRREDRA
jgi:transcriptional regulator with XRE-family HTH domain